MITEKKKTKTFNRCINRLKHGDESLSSLAGHYASDYVDMLKENKETIIGDTPLPENLTSEEIIQYEERMFRIMVVIIEKDLKKNEIPEMEKEVRSMRKVLTNLEELEKRITRKEINYDSEKYDTWAGAGTVVSSDPIFLGENYREDFVVFTENPRPIVWLMVTLQNNCRVDYFNKGVYFHRIAESGKSYIDSGGLTLENESEFFLSNVQRVKKDIRVDLEYEMLSIDVFNKEYDTPIDKRGFSEEEEDEFLD